MDLNNEKQEVKKMLNILCVWKWYGNQHDFKDQCKENL